MEWPVPSTVMVCPDVMRISDVSVMGEVLGQLTENVTVPPPAIADFSAVSVQLDTTVPAA